MISLDIVQNNEIEDLSILATKIVREHYDPIIGKAQNDYMLNKFQSIEGLKKQIKEGYKFYWINLDGKNVGFFSFKEREGKLYISKLYIDKEYRGRGLSKSVMAFLKVVAKENNLPGLFLNVNKRNFDTIEIYKRLGFKLLREECNPIGEGFFMDDYVYEYRI